MVFPNDVEKNISQKEGLIFLILPGKQASA